MDVAALVAQAMEVLLPALPVLLERGWEASKTVAGEWAGEASWEGTKKLWGRLTRGKQASASLLQAARAARQSPDDPRPRNFLAFQLEQRLLDDAELLQDVLRLLAELRPAIAIQVSAGEDSQVAIGNGPTIIRTGDRSPVIVHPPPAGPKPETLRESYLQWVFDQAATLDLAAIDPKGKAEGTKGNAPLGALYTGLLTSELEAKEPRRGGELPERDGKRLSALAQLDAHPQLVLLGEAGGGKSTFVQWVALCLAGAGLGRTDADLEALRLPIPQDEEGKPGEKPRPQPWRHGALLPVRVVLRQFAAKGLPPVGEEATADHLWSFIAAGLPRESLDGFAPQLRRHLLERGGLVLLDGLDEVPEAGERRVQLKQAILGFKSVFRRCRILVTSRVYAYQDQDWVLPAWPVKVLQPFTPAQIRHYVGHWYAHAAAQSSLETEEAGRRAGLLVSTIESRSNLARLARQPLLLALMTSLHNWEGGRLPDKREKLYDESVELLLYRWEASRPPEVGVESPEREPGLARWLEADRSKVRSALERVAAEVHAAQAEPVGAADIPRKDIVDALMDACPAARGKERELVEYLRDRSGILVEREEKTFAFPHRTFQEYLAACQLANDGIPGRLPALLRADPERWREVVLLAGAKAYRGSEALLWSLADALCPEGALVESATAPDFWAAHLATQAVVETADLQNVPAHHHPKLARLRRWLVAVLERSTLPARERALAGRHLAVLGDPRESVTQLDAMELCLVPAGPFVMGSGDEDEMAHKDEKPQHPCEVPYDFWIARYPVTVAQWREYDEGAKPEAPAESLSGDGNAPVADVDWLQAQAFCAWLTARWQDRLPAGWRVRVPSEAEWEKAARGGIEIPPEPVRASAGSLNTSPTSKLRENDPQKRRYPWGDAPDPEKANYGESKIGRPSAVGCFPLGASPYGCEEMSGNVWEWTRTIWGKDWGQPAFEYPYRPGDGRESIYDSASLRVLRGGSFFDATWDVRCAYRYWSRPHNRDDYLGFRVVVSPFSSEL